MSYESERPSTLDITGAGVGDGESYQQSAKLIFVFIAGKPSQIHEVRNSRLSACPVTSR
jgi:hypothetical protein